jgi:hypothetical protein
MCYLLRRNKKWPNFENRLLRRIRGPEGEKMTGAWRKLHNDELHNLYSSPNILMIKSRKIRWAGHEALVGEMRNIVTQKFSLET